MGTAIHVRGLRFGLEHATIMLAAVASCTSAGPARSAPPIRCSATGAFRVTLAVLISCCRRSRGRIVARPLFRLQREPRSATTPESIHPCTVSRGRGLLHEAGRDHVDHGLAVKRPFSMKMRLVCRPVVTLPIT